MNSKRKLSLPFLQLHHQQDSISRRLAAFRHTWSLKDVMVILFYRGYGRRATRRRRRRNNAVAEGDCRFAIFVRKIMWRWFFVALD
jgi:hypothetical protein